MRKIIISRSRKSEEILIEEVGQFDPIFAKNKKGKLCGMIIMEDHRGWILRIGGNLGATGYHSTSKECMESCSEHGYEFFVE